MVFDKKKWSNKPETKDYRVQIYECIMQCGLGFDLFILGR